MDIEYLLWLQGLRENAPDFINSFFMGISDVAATGLPLVVTMVVFWCISKRWGYFIAFNFASCYFVNQVAKITACVYRPWIRDASIVPYGDSMTTATGYSFPSGHASITTSFYGSLAVIFRRCIPAVVVLIALIVLTMFSRNWLGCHTPQDILCSCVLSIVVMFVVYAVTRQLEKHPSWDVAVTLAVCLLCIASLIFCLLKSYPIDYDAAGNILVDPYEMQSDCFRGAGSLMGLMLGWIVERRFVHYVVEGSVLQRIIVAIVGLVVVFSLYGALVPGVCKLFLDTHWTIFFSYIVAMFVAIAGYPALIKAWHAFRARK